MVSGKNENLMMSVNDVSAGKQVKARVLRQCNAYRTPKMRAMKQSQTGACRLCRLCTDVVQAVHVVNGAVVPAFGETKGSLESVPVRM